MISQRLEIGDPEMMEEVVSLLSDMMDACEHESLHMTTRKRARNDKFAQLRPIGVIRSSIKNRSDAPRLGREGAPDAWLEVSSSATECLDGLAPGSDIIVLTWLHMARRQVMRVHPRSDRRNPLTGVFATRSPDRPNPVGLHRVTIRQIIRNRLLIGPIEAIDGTPVIDIKPVLSGLQDF